MAEIKSTLDLVLERTRNLKLTDEEKKSLRIEEVKKRMNGLVQKYLDGLLKLDEIDLEVKQLQKKNQDIDLKSYLCLWILDKIDLTALDGPLPQLLEGLLPVSIQDLQRLGEIYQQVEADQAARRMELLKKHLAQSEGISGSAVLPNLDADPQWRNEINALQNEYNQKLSAAKAAVQLTLAT